MFNKLNDFLLSSEVISEAVAEFEGFAFDDSVLDWRKGSLNGDDLVDSIESCVTQFVSCGLADKELNAVFESVESEFECANYNPFWDLVAVPNEPYDSMNY